MKALKWWQWVLVAVILSGLLAWRLGVTYAPPNSAGAPLPEGYRLVKGDNSRPCYPDTIVRDTAGGIAVAIAFREGSGWRSNFVDPRFAEADARALAQAIAVGL